MGDPGSSSWVVDGTPEPVARALPSCLQNLSFEERNFVVQKFISSCGCLGNNFSPTLQAHFQQSLGLSLDDIQKIFRYVWGTCEYTIYANLFEACVCILGGGSIVMIKASHTYNIMQIVVVEENYIIGNLLIGEDGCVRSFPDHKILHFRIIDKYSFSRNFWRCKYRNVVDCIRAKTFQD